MPRDPFCADCITQACMSHTIAEDAPAYCPTLGFDDVVDKTRAELRDDSRLHNLAVAAARTEAAGYLKWTRVEEIVYFARQIGAKKLGIATCVGLIQESRLASKIFRKQGFKVVSVCCKVGSLDKSEVGLGPEERIHPGNFEAICMPLAQAEILNQRRTDLNILVGLCVGHDSLFFKRSEAPTTVLVVKDRVTGHNPVAALYGCHFYYKRLLNPAG
ncbi:MAG: DUF1847 domain-containing protein [Dehalococcoidia bacterium]|nr:DUF1847 domain-containing protein [Dehalococcoidia bacterium]